MSKTNGESSGSPFILNFEDKDPLIPSLESNHYYYLNKDIDPSTTGDVIRFILERNLMPKEKPKQIKLLVNSYGGDTAAAFALIDIMKGSKIPVHTYGLGCIASSGLLIFMSGKKGKRFISPNTSILSHQFTWGSFGKEHELFAQAREINLTGSRILDHYKKCTGLPEKKIKEFLLPPEDRWLSPKEAIEYGLADEIVEYY